MEGFMLELDNELNSECYDRRWFFSILDIIKKHFKADACALDMSEIGEKHIFTDPPTQKENITINNLHIFNPKVEINEYSKDFLYLYTRNMMKLYDLWKKSHIDSLTNVYNLNALDERKTQCKIFENVGVAFIDANGLGLLNNTLGHEEGDKMLKTLSSIINESFRQREIYRKGGDEFVVLCSGITKEKFCERIAKIKERLAMTEYSASIGLSYAEKTDNIEDQINQADKEMYVEKDIYKNNNPNKYGIK